MILAFPGRQSGHIQLIDLSSVSSNSLDKLEDNMTPQSCILAAHTTALSCIVVNAAGTLLASASEKVPL